MITWTKKWNPCKKWYSIRVYFVWIEYDKSLDFNTQLSMISRERTITSLYPTTQLKSFQMPINNYSNTNSSQYKFQQNNLSHSLCEHLSVHYRLTIECIRSKGALILINSILSYVRVILPFLSQIFFYFFVIEITHPVLFFSFLLFFFCCPL